MGLAAFALWEGYWAFTFLNATIPDEKMDTVAALLMGEVLPGFIGAILLIAWIMVKTWPRT